MNESVEVKLTFLDEETYKANMKALTAYEVIIEEIVNSEGHLGMKQFILDENLIRFGKNFRKAMYDGRKL